MSLFPCLLSLERRMGAALLSVVLLISVLVPTVGGAPVLAMPAPPPPPSPTGLSDPGELETFLDNVISGQLADDHIAGATVAVVKDGRLFFAKGYGYADRQHGKPVSATRTLFRIGSVSKLFTWTAVMQLAEQGKVDLHADVNTYLKTFHLPATYPEPITLAHLLTHTAGFEDRETGLYARTTGDLEPLGQWLAEHIPARVRPPGELTAYSNYGAVLAGYIVEQVSGLHFEQYVEQHLFQPLGMRSSTFRQPVPASLSAALSQGYTYTNGEYHPEPFEAVQVVPAGAMSATATDIANFYDCAFTERALRRPAHLARCHGQRDACAAVRQRSSCARHDLRLLGAAAEPPAPAGTRRRHQPLPLVAGPAARAAGGDVRLLQQRGGRVSP
jgi:CubicO group peptidase (beta-lactamase class C family)